MNKWYAETICKIALHFNKTFLINKSLKYDPPLHILARFNRNLVPILKRHKHPVTIKNINLLIKSRPESSIRILECAPYNSHTLAALVPKSLVDGKLHPRIKDILYQNTQIVDQNLLEIVSRYTDTQVISDLAQRSSDLRISPVITSTHTSLPVTHKIELLFSTKEYENVVQEYLRNRNDLFLHIALKAAIECSYPVDEILATTSYRDISCFSTLLSHYSDPSILTSLLDECCLRDIKIHFPIACALSEKLDHPLLSDSIHPSIPDTLYAPHRINLHHLPSVKLNINTQNLILLECILQNIPYKPREYNEMTLQILCLNNKSTDLQDCISTNAHTAHAFLYALCHSGKTKQAIHLYTRLLSQVSDKETFNALCTVLFHDVGLHFMGIQCCKQVNRTRVEGFNIVAKEYGVLVRESDQWDVVESVLDGKDGVVEIDLE